MVIYACFCAVGNLELQELDRMPHVCLWRDRELQLSNGTDRALTLLPAIVTCEVGST